MKIQTTFFAAVLLVGCAQQPGNAQNQAMPNDGQKMTTAASTPSAIGMVQKVDAGSVTIAHGPVAALQWPAMTMAFKTTPEQLGAIKPGQKVKFEFVVKNGMDATITRISPVP